MERILYFRKNVRYKVYKRCVILYNVYRFEEKIEMAGFTARLLSFIDGKNTVEQVIDKFYKTANEEEQKYHVKEILDYLIEKDFLVFQNEEGYIASSIQKEPCLDFVNLRITNRCNFKCIHCFPDSQGRGVEYTKEEIEDIINQLSEYKVVHITFTGGEPFLNKDLISLVRYANEKGMLVSICTNASLIDDNAIEELQSCAIGALKISLDGCNADQHDTYRGAGKFDKLIPKIQKIIQAGIPVCINTVFSKINYKDYKEMAHFISELGPKEFAFDFIRNSGRASERWDELEISNQDKIEIIKYFEQFGKRMNGVILGSGVFSNIMQSSFCEENVELACGVCINNVVILADGKMVPCWRLHDAGYYAGNIKDSSFEKIWSEADVFQKIRSIKISELEKCSRCQYSCMCDASCRGFALLQHSNWYGAPNTERCELEFHKNSQKEASCLGAVVA